MNYKEEEHVHAWQILIPIVRQQIAEHLVVQQMAVLQQETVQQMDVHQVSLVSQ